MRYWELKEQNLQFKVVSDPHALEPDPYLSIKRVGDMLQTVTIKLSAFDIQIKDGLLVASLRATKKP